MPLNLTVSANVVDLRNDTPKPTDKFFVDTNVWYWLTYSRSKQSSNFPKPYQTNDYPKYIQQTLKAQSKLYKSGLSFPEIAHLIERNERDIFNNANSSDIKPKEFRHNYPNERTNVVQEIQTSWQQIEQFGNTIDVLVNDAILTKADTRLAQDKLDGYDLLMIESILTNGINFVITDDSDFGTISGITVFTANWSLINAAQAQNKLVVR